MERKIVLQAADGFHVAQPLVIGPAFRQKDVKGLRHFRVLPEGGQLFHRKGRACKQEAELVGRFVFPAHPVIGHGGQAPYGVELSEEAVCWSDVLKEEGYRTAYIGKWHLDAPYRPYVDTYNNKGEVAWNEWCPPERRHGFDKWIAYGTYDNHLKPMYWDTKSGREEFYYVNQWGPAYEADRAIEFIRTEGTKTDHPFAMVVSMNPPHTGYELVPETYKRLYDSLDVEALARQLPYIPEKGTPEGDYFRENIRNYYACITGVDEHVGRIIQALKDCGVYDNTLIVFTSDHGVCLGGHGVEGKNVFYEESMRIPMICCWKGKLHPQKSDLPMAFADLYPTLLSLMGMEAQIPASVQTHNWGPLLLNKEIQTPKEAFQPYYFCVPSDSTSGRRGIRTARYTYVTEVEEGQPTHVWLYPLLPENRCRYDP